MTDIGLPPRCPPLPEARTMLVVLSEVDGVWLRARVVRARPPRPPEPPEPRHAWRPPPMPQAE